MAQNPAITLTAQQVHLLKEECDLFNLVIFKRGQILHLQGAVKQVAWIPETEMFTATVQGSRLYHLEIGIDETGVSCECSCPYQHDCKHAAAVLIELLKNESKTEATPQAATPKKITKKQATPPLGSNPADLNAAPESILRKLRKTLHDSSLKCLRRIEGWWEEKKHTATSTELSELIGQSHYWGWKQDSLPLWPDANPPADEMEYLAYLSLALKRIQLSLPSKIEGAITPQVRRQLSEHWERVWHIQKWRDALGHWKEPVPIEGPKALP